MEELRFFDTFNTLKLDDELITYFTNTVVARVALNRAGDNLRVYITSDHIIKKSDIYDVEREIERQLFNGKKVKVSIIENFVLSEVYNIETFLNEYLDSIKAEIKNYNPFIYNVLTRADFSYPNEGEVLITLEESFVSSSGKDEIIRLFEKVLRERCHFNADVFVNFKKPDKSKRNDIAEIKYKQELNKIRQIYNGTRVNHEETGEIIDTTNVSESEVLKYDTVKGEKASGDLSDSKQKGSENSDEKISAKKSSQTGGTAGGTVTGKERRIGNGFDRSKFDAARKKFGQGRYYKSDNPDVICGRDFEDPFTAIADLTGGVENVVIRGQIVRAEEKETKKGNNLFIFDITDFTDTITVKLFPKNEELEDVRKFISTGKYVIVKGVSSLDDFDNELSIRYVVGVKKTVDFVEKRVDDEPVKRVELHCHTKMSDMDAVSDVSDIMKRAADWGHQALAITDHGVVQAFTDAFHKIGGIRKEHPDFKLIYGVEGYLVDDTMEICVNPRTHTLKESFVVFDIETTGFSSEEDRIIEIGAVKIVDGKIIDRFSEFVNPGIPIPYRIEQLTGITDSIVKDAPFIEEVLPKFLSFAEDSVLVAHNARFDVGFVSQKAEELGIETDFSYADTMGMSRVLLPNLFKHKLDSIAKELKISLVNHHRAVDDAEATANIFVCFVKMFREKNIESLAEINEYGRQCSENVVKKLAHYHVIILAKNETGRINLYRLVSLSHLNYFHRFPLIPKSILNKYREGLIIGSACEAGELYSALVDRASEEDIARIVDFYDYLEVQPLGNNEFMIRSDKSRYENIRSTDDLIRLNKRIIDLGTKYNKKVVATCDVHFLDPKDEIYRRIIMSGKKFDDADLQPPLYLRTTGEMLKEFEYLGYDKAYEIVVTNTNYIADMIDYIEPVRPDKCPPVIANSDQLLRDICYRRAHELYGEDLPVQVSSRLERELNSIISNGFAVMYIIAQKLVWKSVEDGYLVGSRGSVGSSFVATMAGITEVNPLSPHYLCPKCHYVDFDSEEVLSYSGKAGCDMPDKICPVCKEKLNKDGFDIPFETFLGFKGDKEPDIDLNFSGEYQSKAHKYTEVIFGYGQTFRAGTIATLADKTAYGYVKNYFEEHGEAKRASEINRITLGCTGVRRSTGQHPGGIIVLPIGDEIYSFTPVQHPANDTTTDIVTTHFDYHSIDHNLLKLDILGHDDPSMIRMLQDLTNTDPTLVPLDDKDVMSLFQNLDALKISPEDIGGTKLGSLGIPEFGTDFAMQMLIDTKPQAFSDLVRIAGLSHGTDVWIGNAKDLIDAGTATISTAICTRDDIMTYLIHMGLEPGTAFSIMENVRKGKVASGGCDKWPGWKQEMLEHGVPEWYVESCEKIKYMFPKAHAAAYVMMAWRVAYYKVNYPLAYYAAFFSIRASAFDYEKMCLGKARLDHFLEEYLSKPSDSLSNKEKDEIKDMRLVQEMYARGYDFMPIDIFTAEAHRCKVIDGKIMPHIGSIAGLGDKAADAVVDACKDGPFLSRDDFKERTKATQSAIDTMTKLGLLGDLPESNQLSLFDL